MSRPLALLVPLGLVGCPAPPEDVPRGSDGPVLDPTDRCDPWVSDDPRDAGDEALDGRDLDGALTLLEAQVADTRACRFQTWSCTEDGSTFTVVEGPVASQEALPSTLLTRRLYYGDDGALSAVALVSTEDCPYPGDTRITWHGRRLAACVPTDEPAVVGGCEVACDDLQPTPAGRPTPCDRSSFDARLTPVVAAGRVFAADGLLPGGRALVVPERDTGRVSTWRPTADSWEAGPTLAGTEGPLSSRIGVGDVDGDGVDDVLVVEPGLAVRVHLGPLSPSDEPAHAWSVDAHDATLIDAVPDRPGLEVAVVAGGEVSVWIPGIGEVADTWSEPVAVPTPTRVFATSSGDVLLLEAEQERLMRLPVLRASSAEALPVLAAEDMASSSFGPNGGTVIELLEDLPGLDGPVVAASILVEGLPMLGGGLFDLGVWHPLDRIGVSERVGWVSAPTAHLPPHGDGATVAAADLDGDGTPELLVGEPGARARLPGPACIDLEGRYEDGFSSAGVVTWHPHRESRPDDTAAWSAGEPVVIFSGTTRSHRLGARISVVDVDGDGRDEVWIGHGAWGRLADEVDGDLLAAPCGP